MSGNGSNGSVTQLFKVAHESMVTKLWDMWKGERSGADGLSDEIFQRLSVVAMSQVAAIIAVDVTITEEQFLSICQANFKEAYRKAPKWG